MKYGTICYGKNIFIIISLLFTVINSFFTFNFEIIGSCAFQSVTLLGAQSFFKYIETVEIYYLKITNECQ